MNYVLKVELRWWAIWSSHAIFFLSREHVIKYRNRLNRVDCCALRNVVSISFSFTTMTFLQYDFLFDKSIFPEE